MSLEKGLPILEMAPRLRPPRLTTPPRFIRNSSPLFIMCGMSNWVIAVIWGVVGGGIRIAIGRTFIWPHRTRLEGGKPGFDLGFVGPLVAGGAAGFVLWALVTNQLFADQGFGVRTVAATILVGMGGGDALMHYLSKRYGVTVTQQVNQETSAIAKPLAESQKTLTQEVADLREREGQLQEQNRKLQEEIDRLKKSDS